MKGTRLCSAGGGTFLDHLTGETKQIPALCQAVDMTFDQYLAKNTIEIFDIPDPVILIC